MVSHIITFLHYSSSNKQICFDTGLGLGGPGAIAVIGGGPGIAGGIGGHDAGVAVINGPSGAIHAGLGSHGAIIPGGIGKW